MDFLGLAANVCEIPAFAGMVCGGLWFVYGLAFGWGRQFGGGRALPLEIPAFAGMVCGVTGNRGRIWDLPLPPPPN